MLAALAGWLLSFAPAAYAHAELVVTNPGNGEHLAAGPKELTLRFSEGVNTVHDGIRVLDKDGKQLNKAAARSAGDTIHVPVPANLKDGVYTVDWRVVSEDSHPIHGAFVFSIGDATAAPLTGPVSNSGADGLVSAAFWVFRLGGYAGLALLVGGAFFRIVCWPEGGLDRRARRILVGAWTTSLVAAIGSLLLQGPNSTGASVWRAFDPSLLVETVKTDYGVSVLVRLVLLAAAWFGLRMIFAGPRPAATGDQSPDVTDAGTRDDAVDGASAGTLRPQQVALLGGTALGLAATWSFAGHAHVGDQPVLAVAADVTHLSAMSVWVGGLTLLTTCVLPQGRAVLSQAARVLPRFSTCAMTAVGLLLATGTYQAWRQVREVSALSGSDYGKLLIFKLATFGILMAIASMSRSAVQRRYVLPAAHASAAQAPPRPRNSKSADAGSGASGDRLTKKERREQDEAERTALGALRQSVRLEAGIVLGVLGLTSALVATPPGQVAGAFEAAPAVGQQPVAGPYISEQRLPGTAGSLKVRVDPARSGRNGITLTVSGKDNSSLDPKDVTASLTLPDKKLGPLPVELKHTAVGQYTADTVTVPTSGTWQLSVGVRMSEFDQTTLKFNVPIL